MTTVFEHASRIVIKIGSAILVGDNGKLRKGWLKTLAKDLQPLINDGKQIILVSSGAVALGKHSIHHLRDALKLEEKQAAAALGQTKLIHAYQKAFKHVDMHVAQILVTIQDTENRRRYLNAKNTIETLLQSSVIPIINENDTVATNELRFGDNDRLAAKVAQMIAADVLILLSDVDGLYTEDPRLNPQAEHIANVDSISEDIENMAGVSISRYGSGGMMTKIQASKIAVAAGCHTVITHGKNHHPLRALLEGGKATWFSPSCTPQAARKQWIASSLHIKGEVIVDDGALIALQQGKSLLPAGVIDISGNFDRGDAVAIKDCRLQLLGKGLIAYNSNDAQLIKGQQSSEIENIVGFSGRSEMIHRDDLALDQTLKTQ